MKAADEFVRLPGRILGALGRAELSHDELAILVCLHGRSSAQGKITTTLDQVAAATAWPKSRDNLLKRLGHLRKDGWLTYPPPRRTRPPRYVIQLRHGAPNQRPGLPTNSSLSEVAASTIAGTATVDQDPEQRAPLAAQELKQVPDDTQLRTTYPIAEPGTWLAEVVPRVQAMVSDRERETPSEVDTSSVHDELTKDGELEINLQTVLFSYNELQTKRGT